MKNMIMAVQSLIIIILIGLLYVLNKSNGILDQTVNAISMDYANLLKKIPEPKILTEAEINKLQEQQPQK